MVDREKMPNGIRAIGKLNANAERLMELGAMVGELENRVAISDEIANVKLTKSKEMKKRKENRMSEIPHYATIYKRVGKKSL